MKTYKSASIRIMNRPEFLLLSEDAKTPVIFFRDNIPLTVELYTRPAYSALVDATRDELTPECVRSAIDAAARDTFLRTVVGKKLLVADIEAMEFLAEFLTIWNGNGH